MLGRLIASFLFALIIGLIIFAIVTVAFPQSLMVMEPVFCKDWQTMEIRTPSTGSQDEFNIEAYCTGDGDVPVGAEILVAMFGVYFLPLFTLLYLLMVNSARNSSRINRQFYETGQMDFNKVPGMQSFTVAVNNLDTDMISDTLELVKEALSDGVITKEEFEQIQARVTNQATGSKQAGTLSERLSELQQAYSQGLITQAEYDEKRRKILDNA